MHALLLFCLFCFLSSFFVFIWKICCFDVGFQSLVFFKKLFKMKLKFSFLLIELTRVVIFFGYLVLLDSFPSWVLIWEIPADQKG